MNQKSQRKEVLFIPVKKKVAEKPKVEKAKYTCLCCGVEKSETQFYMNKWSDLWTYSDKKIPYCKDCVQKRFDTYKTRYESDKTALLICCYVLDIPFYSTLYKSISDNNSIFSVGLYMRQLQLGQYQMKTFLNTLMSDELGKTDDQVREEVETRWSKADKQNKNFAISVVGYDPFENCGMVDNDRKYCFNILASYCDADGIQEDGHKIQSVIQITHSQLQCRKLDEFINEELLKPVPDENRIKQLTTTKKQLLDSISKTAQDNNISSAYNSSSKQGINTLSHKMKEMMQAGYDNIEFNLFDIKTSDAMKQIADLSNRSILDQISLDSNDYTEIVKDQREMIVKYQNQIDEVVEENRKLKNQIVDLTTKKAR